jgi:hypothetical protein
MKHLVVSLTIGACLLVPSAGMTLAGQPGTNAGQKFELKRPRTAANRLSLYLLA